MDSRPRLRPDQPTFASSTSTEPLPLPPDPDPTSEQPCTRLELHQVRYRGSSSATTFNVNKANVLMHAVRMHAPSPLLLRSLALTSCSLSRSPSRHRGTFYRSHHYLFYQHSGHRPHGQSFSDHITFVHADTFYSIFRHHSNEPNHSTFVAPALRTQPPFSTRRRFRLCTPRVVRLSLLMRPLPRLFLLHACAMRATPKSTVLPPVTRLTIDLVIFVGTGIYIHFFSAPCPAPLTYSPTATAASGSFAPQLKQRLHLRPNPRPRIKFRTLPASITAHSPLSLSFPISLSLSLSFPPATHQAWAG